MAAGKKNNGRKLETKKGHAHQDKIKLLTGEIETARELTNDRYIQNTVPCPG